MEFVQQVRKDKIPGPLRRKFDRKIWAAEYGKFGNDIHDKGLYEAGLFIIERLDGIRKRLTLVLSTEISATTKLRAFVAITNYEQSIVRSKARQSVKEASDGLVFAPDIAAVKLRLAGGGEHSPDEILQTIVDGIELPIREILRIEPDLGGTPTFKRLDWEVLLREFNLGSMYKQFENLWDDCLWNEYVPIEGSDAIRFTSTDAKWLSRRVVSKYRFDNLAMQEATIATSYLQAMPDREIQTLPAIRPIIGVSKSGRNQNVQLGGITSEATAGQQRNWLLLKLEASEPYYEDLLSESQEKLSGGSIQDLLRVWIVVQSAAKHFEAEIDASPLSADDAPHQWLPRFAPILRTDSLVLAVAKSLSLEQRKVSSIIDYLTFKDRKGEELWAQPLVPVGKESISLVFAAFTPNFKRLVDVWLSQLGVDLSRRGPAFETHVRSFLEKKIASSLLRGTSTVLNRAFVFCPVGERNEEIDILFSIGDLVCVGEVKCAKIPTEAKGHAEHRNVVIGAVSQVTRKVKAIERNKGEFQRKLRQLGFFLPDQYRVLPLVILNSAINAGFEVSGVPIVDLHILGVFFDGKLAEAAIQNPSGKMTQLKMTRIYSSAQEAALVAVDYFCVPPQMKPLLEGLRERWVPIPCLTQDDRRSEYRSVTIAVDWAKYQHLV